ncbi:MAG: SRPBCC domain-containing protein [Gammaproteobacteria bacterium]|nr:SRPBCC domain-containing protein [Gammaproteobacteria bacterium]
MSMPPLVIKQKFKLSKRELFDAWSKPEIMKRWFFATEEESASCRVDNQFITNGHYNLVMHFKQGEVQIHGQYLEINRYNFICFTWNSPTAQNTKVELKFRSLSSNRSELTLTHYLLPEQSSVDQHHTGWLICFNNLNKLEPAIIND